VSSEPPLPATLVAEVRSAVAAVDEYVARGDLSFALPVIDSLVTAAARLLTACSDAQLDPALSAESLAPTEALTLVGALLRTHDINAFDLALWLSHTGPDSSINAASTPEEP
jgi:hypothetical protein